MEKTYCIADTTHRAAFHQPYFIVDKVAAMRCPWPRRFEKMALGSNVMSNGFLGSQRTDRLSLWVSSNGPIANRLERENAASSCRHDWYEKTTKPYLVVWLAGRLSYYWLRGENADRSSWMGNGHPRSNLTANRLIDLATFDLKKARYRIPWKSLSGDGIPRSIRDLNSGVQRDCDSGKWVIRWRGPSSRRAWFWGITTIMWRK